MEWNRKRFGESTLERYWKWLRQDGFEGLMPSERSDVGKSRVLRDEFLAELVRRRLLYPQLSVKELVRAMVKDGSATRVNWGSLPSIYRYLRRKGLDGKTLAIKGPHGPTKAFEVMSVNDLWMVDVMYGPVLKTTQGKTISTRLIALIDDASRVIPNAEYRAQEKEEDFWMVLQKGMERRGVPRKLYTDNGKIFTSLRTRAACANLGIELIHAKPYAAWSKGKIEKLFQTVQTQLEARLTQNPVRNLDELNHALWQWMETEYHVRKHGGLDNKSPQTRFAEDTAKLRLLDVDKLAACFWQQETRRVRRDATVFWRGAQWEVPVFLRGQKILLKYDPLHPSHPVEIWHEKKLVGQLKKLDRQLNSRIQSKRETYE